MALDFEPDNIENEQLSLQLLAMAASLCVALFAELHVIRCNEAG